MAKVNKSPIASKVKPTTNTPTASTNKLTGANKRISPGKKRKPANTKATSTKPANSTSKPTKTSTKAATSKVATNPISTKLTPPITHYPIFLLAHQLPNFNDTINKAKKSPYLYSSEKQKTEKLLVSLFLHQYKTWYKAQKNSDENPTISYLTIPKPITQKITLLTIYHYSSNFDHDNISFAKKYILDALQLANIIQNDDHSIISSSIDITSVKKKGKVGAGDIPQPHQNFITVHLVPENEILSIINKYL